MKLSTARAQVDGCDRDGCRPESRPLLPARRLVGVQEVAAYLHLPVGWVYKHRQEIPHYKIGKYLRFDLDDVEAWSRSKRTGEALHDSSAH